MSRRELLDPEGSLWDLIAVQLRRHREERKISGSALGALLDVDRSTVSRLESGDIKMLEKHAKLLDREWDTRGLFVTLVRFAKEGHDREWFATHLEMEARHRNCEYGNSRGHPAYSRQSTTHERWSGQRDFLTSMPRSRLG